VDYYDAWCEMNEEEDGRFRLFYRHVLRLRLEVGLSNEGLPSLDDWYMRNAGLWNGDALLSWGTYDEAMKIIKVAYEERFGQTYRESDGSQAYCREPQYLWNFVDRLNNKDHVQRTVIDGRASDLRFHNTLEAKLRAAGALKYQFSAREH
jgi:hypothetical protein